MENPVLIISTTVDVSTDAVVLELERLARPFIRINTDAYPYDESVTIDLHGPSATLALRTGVVVPRSVWYRRLRSPPRPDVIEPGIHRYCVGEGQALLRGLGCSAAARVMSQPDAVFRAESKIVQLEEAQAVGLRVPSSCITNDPTRARAFIDAHERSICKPLRSGWFEDDEGQWSIYTTEVTPEMTSRLDSVSLAPSIFQELVPKRCDVRVTIVGRRVFAAAIDSQSDDASKIDWRRTTNPELPHTPCELPTRVEDRLLELMARLHLEFGAIDLVRTPDDDYVFLEVNPNGQWLWIDHQLDLGITTAVARWLAVEGELADDTQLFPGADQPEAAEPTPGGPPPKGSAERTDDAALALPRTDEPRAADVRDSSALSATMTLPAKTPTARGVLSWARDCVVPRPDPIDPKDATRRAEELKRAEASIEGLFKGQPNGGTRAAPAATQQRDRLRAVADDALALLEAEAKRRQGVESRLTTILGLVAVASTITIWALGAQLAGTLYPVRSIVAYVVLALVVYMVVQLVLAGFAAVKGLSSRAFEVLLPTTYFAEAEELEHWKRLAKERLRCSFQHEEAINKKVSQFALAQRSLQNFLFALLLLIAVVAVSWSVNGDEQTAAENKLLEMLRENRALADELRGPDGAPGVEGPRGPSGERGPVGPKGDRGEAAAAAPTEPATKRHTPRRRRGPNDDVPGR